MDKLPYFLTLVAVAAFMSAVFFSYVNPGGIQGVFYSETGDVDKKYFQQVTPQPYAFMIIWPIIFFLNLLGICYIAASLCLPEYISMVKVKPTLVPKAFLLDYIITYTSATVWLFAFDWELLELSLFLLVLATFSLYSCIRISYKVIHDNLANLEVNNRAMLWLVRTVVQNSLCTLATWLTIATLINFADVLIYKSSFGVSPPVMRGIVSVVDGSSIALTLLTVVIIVWFALENFVYEEYCRYTFTIYPVLIFGLSALVDKLQQLQNADRNLFIASLNLSLAEVALAARIGLFAWRWNKRAKSKAE